jgi:hypothetical protein
VKKERRPSPHLRGNLPSPRFARAAMAAHKALEAVARRTGVDLHYTLKLKRRI